MINELQILNVNKCCAGNYFFGHQQFFEFLTNKSLNRGLIPKNWTVEKCSSAQVKGAEGNEEKSVQ